jgi:uncharacterized protein (TIGR02569 family)
MSNSSPDPEIIASFSCAGVRQKLYGGEGNAVRVGDCVFKPIDNPERYSWACELLLQLPQSGFRISEPLRSKDETFAHSGWGASAYEQGEHVNGRWQEKVRISKLFHAELNELELTPMPSSDDFWSQAHEIAWQVIPIPASLHPKMTTRIEDIFRHYQPLSRGQGVIHSDLCGNFLFQDGLDPCIIDFSPAYGSVEYGEAILVADAIAWEDAPQEIVDLISNDEHYRQNLLRAINFRVIVAALFRPENIDWFLFEYAAFKPLTDHLLSMTMVD